MIRRIIIMASIFLVLNLYVGWHGAALLRYFDLMPPAPVYWLLFFLITFSYLIARSSLLPEPFRTWLKALGSYYFVLFEFTIILLPLADLAAWLMRLTGMDATASYAWLGAIVVLILIVSLARGSWNAWTPITRTYEMSIPKHAGGLRQLKIVVASDIHLGDMVGKRHLQRLVDRVRELKPDIVLLPGDVIDDSIKPFIRKNMSEVMRELKAPLGVYAVLGNHEYYGGHIEEYVKRMEQIGIRVLMDEVTSIRDAFYVAGRKDKTAEAMDPNGRLPVNELLAGLDHSLPVILMDHQPYAFDKAAGAGADLLLCGHTHRGQFAPNHWITRRLFELDWGYMKKDSMHVVVSSGFGTWGPPIRLVSRSEIVQIVIQFEEEGAAL